MHLVGAVEKETKAKARARICRSKHPGGPHFVMAEVVYRGQHYSVRVDVKPGESEIVVLEVAFEELKRRAKAVALTDLRSGERIR